MAPPLPNTRQDPYRRGHRIRRPAGRPRAVPQAEGMPEAEPQVPQCGGGLTRAYVRSPLLGGGKAVLVPVHLARKCVNHRSSIRWKFSRAALAACPLGRRTESPEMDTAAPDAPDVRQPAWGSILANAK